MKRSRLLFGTLLISTLSLSVRAQTLVSWDINGLDMDGTLSSPSYSLSATLDDSNIASASLSISSSVNPSTTDNRFGFKVSTPSTQSTLAGAISNEHYLQFTLTAAEGYTFTVTSLEFIGGTTGDGADDVALLSNVDGFTDTSAIASVTGRAGDADGLDTDSSGFGSSITLSGMQYQNLSTITFRLYGWNTSSGSGDTFLRNLSGADLEVFGTTAVSAVPEPSTYAALAGLAILGFAAYRRRNRNVAALAA